jgi:hypothetical protein
VSAPAFIQLDPRLVEPRDRGGSVSAWARRGLAAVRAGIGPDLGRSACRVHPPERRAPRSGLDSPREPDPDHRRYALRRLGRHFGGQR